MKRILFVDHSGVTGGAEFSLLELLKRLPVSSEVLLLSDGPFRDLLEDAKIPVSVLQGGKQLQTIHRESSAARSIFLLPRFINLCYHLFKRARPFEILYANSQKSFYLCAFVALLQRKPLIWHLRDIPDRTHFSRWSLRLMQFFGRFFATIIIAVSKATEKSLLQLGIPGKKVTVIHSTVDHLPFETVRASVSQIRATLGISTEDFVIGSFSRLTPWKGQQLLIKAMTNVPGLTALIVGAPLFGETAFEEELRHQIVQAGLESRVHFLGFRKDIPELMKACDIMVHSPAAPEPFGRVLIEGMFAERPVLASAAGGTVEIIENERSGLLFRPGSAEDLREKILWLKNNSTRREEIAREGKIRALKFFSAEASVNQVMRVLDEVTSRKMSS